MEQKCIDNDTVNNYHGSTKFLQLQKYSCCITFCKVWMEESSSSSSVVVTVDVALCSFATEHKSR